MSDSKTTPVTTNLALLELIEWHAEATFKQLASEVVGAKNVSKMGKKQIGDVLRKALDRYEKKKREIELWEKENAIVPGVTPGRETSGIEAFMMNTWPYLHHIEGQWLLNIIIPEIIVLSKTIYTKNNNQIYGQKTSLRSGEASTTRRTR